jgi:hypothetical protein
MKRYFLSAVILGITVTPALAGGGSGDTGAGAVLLRAIVHVARNLIGL